MGKREKKDGEKKDKGKEPEAPEAPKAPEVPKAPEAPKGEKKSLSGMSARIEAWVRAFCPDELGDSPTEKDVFALVTRLMKYALDNDGLKAPVPGQTLETPDEPGKAKTLDEAVEVAVAEYGLDPATIVAKREHGTYFKIVYDGSPGWLHIPKA
jgi:hypothetical protein